MDNKIISIHWFKGKWVPFVNTRHHKKYLGRYNTRQEAIEVRDKYIMDNKLSPLMLNEKWKYPTYNEWKCPKCNQVKSVNDFIQHISASYKSAKRAVERRVCSECRSKKANNSKSNFGGYGSNATMQIKYKNKSTRNFWIMRLGQIRQRAKKRTLGCVLTIDDVMKIWDIQNGVCSLCGKPMKCIAGSGDVHENSSLDRINNSIGYNVSNVRLTHVICNRMRSTLSDIELKNKCIDIVNFLNPTG